MAIGTPNTLADGHISSGGTTTSISPTSGADLFLVVHAGDTDTTDPFAASEDFTISGLSGTWTRLQGTMFRIGTGNVLAALFHCNDWTGTGSLTITHSGDGSVDANEVGYSVLEVTGLSSTVPFIGVTKSPTGYVEFDAAGNMPMNIGFDTADTVPTNGDTLSWFLDGEIATNPTVGLDTTNWTQESQLNDTASNRRFLITAYSTNGDVTPAWSSDTTSQLGAAGFGLILVEDGNEPTEYKDLVLEMRETAWADGDLVVDDADWTRLTSAGSQATADNHSDHGPSRVIDMGNITRDRLVHNTQVGDDDHWVACKWFMDKDSGGTVNNSVDLILRHNGTSQATVDGYRVQFAKDPSAGRDVSLIRVYEVTNGTGSQVAIMNTAFTPASSNQESAIVLFTEIVGGVIKAYVNGELKLTHDTTGDGTVHTTGQYTGFQILRDVASTDSQPFIYDWRAGTFATVPGAPVIQRGSSTETQVQYGTGVTLAKPSSLTADDVVMLVIGADNVSGDPQWACSGFTTVDVVQFGSTSITVMAATGQTSAGNFTITSPTYGSTDWLEATATAWVNADINNFVVGTELGWWPNGASNSTVPAVTSTEDDSIIFLAWRQQFGDSTSSFTPAGTNQGTSASTKVRTRSQATAGSSGTVEVVNGNVFGDTVAVQIAIQPIQPAGGTPLTETVTDTVGITDTAVTAKTIAVTVTDSIGLTDATATAKTAAVTVTDTIGVDDSIVGVRDRGYDIGITDDVVVTKTIAATVTDDIGLTDEANLTESTSVTDTVGITDTAVPAKTIAVTVTDDIGLADQAVPAKTVTITATDDVGLTDEATPVKAIAVTVTDDIGVTDQLTRVIDWNRSATDPIGIADTQMVVEDDAASVTDQVGITDAVTRTIDWTRPVTDQVGLTDQVVTAKTIAVTVTDDIGLTDQADPAKTVTVAVTDDIGLTDQTARTVDHGRTVTDDIGLADESTPVKAAQITATDDIGLTDEASPVKAIAVSVTDTIGLTDTLTRVHDAIRAVTDPVGISDTQVISEDGAKTVTDQVGITDTVVVTKTLVRSVTDDIGLTDQAVPAKTVTVVATDDVGLTDEATPVKAAQATVSDDIGITDQTATAKTVTVTTTDAIGLTDATAAAKTIAVTVTDSIGVTDATATAKTVTVTAADTIGVTDTPTRVHDAIRAATDQVGITDVANADVTGADSVTRTESIGLTDAVARTIDWSRPASDTVGITDAVVVARTTSTAVTDDVGLTDQVVTAKTIQVTVTDGIGVVDSTVSSGEGATQVVDGIGLTDTVVTTRVTVRSATDTIGLTDAATGVGEGATEVTDTIGLTDATATAKIIQVTVVDGITVTDDVEEASQGVGISDTVVITKTMVREAVDPIGITDTVGAGEPPPPITGPRKIQRADIERCIFRAVYR